MSGYILEARTQGRRTWAQELPDPWVLRCTCGLREEINPLGAGRALMEHVRIAHWLPSLVEWNLR